MNIKWELGYDGLLFLKYDENPDSPMTSTAFYKLNIKRYVNSINSGFIRFKPELSYLTYKIIMHKCKVECCKRGYVFEITSDLNSYIENRELYIEKRYSLGNEIKNQDNKLLNRFEEYSNIVNTCMSRQLRLQQMWDSFFMCSMQKSANFSVPGSGKTSSVLGVFAFLKFKSLVNRIVVICPKNAFGSWIDEFNECFRGKMDLNLLNIHDEKFRSKERKERALLYDSGSANLILINYESLGTYINPAKRLIKSDTLLVYDEVHKVKSLNGEHARYAVELAENANRTIIMTGTPIPNGYIDIYNFLHILFPNEYDDFFGFSSSLLKSPDDYDIIQINDKLQPFFCRTTKEQLNVPSANKDEIIEVNSNNVENDILRILKIKYKKNQLALFIRILQLETNPKLLTQRLDFSEFKNLLDEDIEDIDTLEFQDYSNQIKELLIKNKIATKFDTCIKLASKLVKEGKTLIIWCIFKESINSLANSLKNLGISAQCIYGEVPLENRIDIISDFKTGKYQVLITNPHTLAESVSLHSVCHDAIYYEYSYNLVHLLQSKDRIHRLGLEKNQYTQYYFLQQNYLINDNEKWSMDKNVYERLKIKEQIMLEAIKNHKLEIMPTTEEDLSLIFKKLDL